MILSDASILERTSQDADEPTSIGINPEPENVQYQPISIDLRLGDSYTDESIGEEYEDCYVVEFEPSHFHLAHTLERIDMPNDLCGLITGRSSLARNGLFILPIVVHPGFSGQITLQIYNLTESPISVPPQKRVAQIAFLKLDQPVETGYGDKEDTKYQGQKGPTKSKEDF